MLVLLSVAWAHIHKARSVEQLRINASNWQLKEQAIFWSTVLSNMVAFLQTRAILLDFVRLLKVIVSNLYCCHIAKSI